MRLEQSELFHVVDEALGTGVVFFVSGLPNAEYAVIDGRYQPCFVWLLRQRTAPCLRDGACFLLVETFPAQFKFACLLFLRSFCHRLQLKVCLAIIREG